MKNKKRSARRFAHYSDQSFIKLALCICLVGVMMVSAAHTRAIAAGPRVLPSGELPNDSRLGNLKDLDGYFPFVPSKTPQQWKKRSEYVRRQVLVACGLWPMPTKTPVKAVVHGLVDRDDYTVEKVYLQSFPGLYITGSLYRPKGKKGPLPAVLCPHGHWSSGRFHDHGVDGVKKEIASGAEQFEIGGRHPLQARCVQLVRMGCVVFHYDMLGYADSVPLTYQLAHRFGKQRSELSGREGWGLFSAQSELRLQNALGLQTLNSVRALDWLSSLASVDSKRIAVTGASGGGTQTFILSAIDPRVAVAFPAVMVSTAMQGGCTCENATYLRVGTGNIELAALFAPRPLGLSAANDWTKEIETKGLPELREHYKMLGVPNLITGKHFDFGHNYNSVSRAMMYDWMNRHLKLGQKLPIVERDYKPLAQAELSVWNDAHPKPASGTKQEVALLKELDADSDRVIARLQRGSKSEYRKIIGGALDVMIGRGLSDAKQIEYKKISETDHGDYIEFTSLLLNKQYGEELPTIFLMPKKRKNEVAIWISRDGKSSLYGTDGKPNKGVRRLLNAGITVAGVDLFYQGEFLKEGKPLTKTRKVGNPREFAGFTLGYNHPLFSRRVHDILTLVSFAKNHKEKQERVHLIGLGGAGHWVAAATAQAGDAVDRIVIDTNGFRFADVTDIRDPDFLPGAKKYGDLPGILALCSDHDLFLKDGEQPLSIVLKSAYRSGGKGNLTRDNGQETAIDWLLK